MDKQETRDFAISDAVATVGLRDDGSMWVSVQSKSGSHFQCDFIGNFEVGPMSKADFSCELDSYYQAWLIKALHSMERDDG